MWLQCVGGVAILAITVHRAIAIVGIAIRRLEDRVRIVLVARISRVMSFALERILGSVVATSKWECFAWRMNDWRYTADVVATRICPVEKEVVIVGSVLASVPFILTGELHAWCAPWEQQKG